MNGELRLESADTGSELAHGIASQIIAICVDRQQQGAVPTLVLTGGSMGKASLAAIAEHAERDRVEWHRVRFLWGDERWVPAGDAERNDRLADELLFGSVETDTELVHRVAASDGSLDLDDAAAAYAELIDGLDRIDVVMNGVGPDGHICSLFPGRDDLLRNEPGTASALPVRESPKPPPERVTFSIPAVDRADHVWLLAAGAEKAPAVEQILNPSADLDRLPAARVAGRTDTVLWADAAALGRAAH